MEAVPRLPMLSFPRKENTEKSSFTGLKQYIGECYGENPDSYSKEIYELEMLRNKAVRASEDLDGLAVMKRYVCQIHSIGNRFPLGDENPVLSFSWREIHSPTVWQSSSLRYEICVMLYNVAAMHMQLGSEETRTSPESMKVACTHFQCAGWIYGYIRDNYPASMRHELTGELLELMKNIAFGQAQECILEKSLADNRKAVTVAKVTSQIVSYYNSAMAVLLTTVDGESISDIVGGKTFKSWKRFVKFKISYLSAILYLYQGQSTEDAGRAKNDPNQVAWAGECVTLFKAADEKIKEAQKDSKGIENIDAINEALTFTNEVITAKYENANKDNEFIYHAPKPELKDLSAVQAANLVNGISFNFADTELMGEDIFHRLVPMKAHESSSIYSEEKANILRTIAKTVEEKNDELATFMSSLNIDTLHNSTSSLQQHKLPQSLVDRCAVLAAKPNAISDLVSSMSSLAETSVEVEAMLKEIKYQFSEEQKQEEYYQKTMGHRPPGGHIQELAREFQKYLEAHNKASENNDTLRKAMGLHVQNLKILSLPLAEIKKSVPVLGPEIDEAALKDLDLLLKKVDEMKSQREILISQLRESINNDDITSQVIAWGDKKIEKLFEQELTKHDKYIKLLEQNMAAQTNILKATTDTYAKCAMIIKAINETKAKRDQFFNSLTASFDVYEDLLGKSTKGLEFYKKLHGNVQKLMSRVKAAKDVQDEERSQRIQAKVKQQQVIPNSGGMSMQDTPKIHNTGRTGPKLKDYLNSGFSVSSKTQQQQQPQNEVSQPTFIPHVRPSPLGSESVIDPKLSDMAVTGPTYKNISSGYKMDYNKGSTQMPMQPAYDQNYAHYPNPTQYNQNPIQNSMTYPYQQQYSTNNQNVSAQVPQYSSSSNPGMQNSPGYVNPIYQPPYYGQANQTPPPPTSYQPTPGITASTNSTLNNYGNVPTNQNYSNYNMSGQVPTNLNQQFGQMNLNNAMQPNQVSQNNQIPMQNYNQSMNYGQNINPSGYNANQYSSNLNQYNQNAKNIQENPQNFSNGIQYQTMNVSQPSNIAYSNTVTSTQNSSIASSMPLTSTVTNVTPSNSNYSLTSHPTNPMYMGLQGVIKETGIDPSQQLSPKPNQDVSQNANSSPANSQTGPFSNLNSFGPMNQSYTVNSIGSYGNQYSSSSTNVLSMGQANTNNGGIMTDSSNVGVGGKTYVSQYESTQANMTVPTNTGTLPYYTIQYGTHLDHTSSSLSSNSYQTPSYFSSNNVANNCMTYINCSEKPGTLMSLGINQGPSMTSQEQSQPVNQQQWNSGNTIPTQMSKELIQPTTVQTPTPAPIKSANIDLLSDIDFSLNTSLATPAIPTLQPQVIQKQDDQLSEINVNTTHSSPVKKVEIPLSPIPVQAIPSQIIQPPSTPIDRKSSVDDLSVCSDVSSIDPNFDWESASLKNEDGLVLNKTSTDSITSKYKDAFDDPKILKWFHKEVERLEKFIETSTIKTLNGTTPLDGKWKELQDSLVKDESKRTVNVARLFPEKNRSIDSIPYDHARVSLGTTTDDYINAGYVKDLGAGFPTFILAQTPLSNTVNDFWSMIWSENLNTVVCLHPPTEILDVYWPQDVNGTLTFGDFDVTLMKQFDLSHCVERSVKVSMHGQDKILYVSLLQIKAWIKNSANHILGIAQNVITSYKQQNQDKKQSSALVIHCLTGSDRSGLVTLSVASILATSSRRPILINVVDVWYRICSQRKGALRDISVLQLSLQIVLNNSHSILNKRGIMTSYQMKNMQQQAALEKEEKTINDPFKDLDPLWKMKK
uniref:CSON009406 protein n=1 Tax=Culicoides sonorensis TaxID=179676 RepID=A0A336M0Q9_CULSO